MQPYTFFMHHDRQAVPGFEVMFCLDHAAAEREAQPRLLRFSDYDEIWVTTLNEPDFSVRRSFGEVTGGAAMASA